jgi:hypothetical protein
MSDTKQLKMILENLLQQIKDGKSPKVVIQSSVPNEEEDTLARLLLSHEMSKFTLAEMLPAEPYKIMLLLNSHIAATACAYLVSCVQDDEGEKGLMLNILKGLHEKQLDFLAVSAKRIKEDFKAHKESCENCEEDKK